MINIREMLMLGAVAATIVAIPALVAVDQRGHSDTASPRPEPQPCATGAVAILPNTECGAQPPQTALRPNQATDDTSVSAPSRPWTDPDSVTASNATESPVPGDASPSDEPARTGALQPPSPPETSRSVTAAIEAPGPASAMSAREEPRERSEAPSVTQEPVVKAPPRAAAPRERKEASLPRPQSDANFDGPSIATEPNAPNAASVVPPARPTILPEQSPPGAKSERNAGSKVEEPFRPEEESKALASRYLEAWSSDNPAAFNDMRNLFGPRVTYFGHSMDRDAIFNAKKRFAERWPVRRYRPRPGSMTAQCEATECRVRSIVDWEAASPARKAHSRGALRFELGIDISGARPLVRAENSQEIASLAPKPPRAEASAAPERPRPGRQVARRPPLQLPSALLPDDTDSDIDDEELLFPEN